MDLYYEFDKDLRTLSAKQGRVYGGQMFDNCSTTLHFEHTCYEPLSPETGLPDNRAEWDFTDEGYHAYIVFRIRDECTGYPLTYGDSSSPRFDGYTFKVPYEITRDVARARVEFQLYFVKSPEFTGNTCDLAEGTEFMFSSKNGFALKGGVMDGAPRGRPDRRACAPANPMTCEPSVLGWLEMWKDRGLLMPVDHRQQLDPQARFAKDVLSFVTYRNEIQQIVLNSPTLDAEDKLPLAVIRTGADPDRIPLLKGTFFDGDLVAYSAEDKGFVPQPVSEAGDSLRDDPEALVRAAMVPQNVEYSGKVREDRRTETLTLLDGTGRVVCDTHIPTIPVSISFEATLPGKAGKNYVVLKDGDGNILDYADLPLESLISETRYDEDTNSLVIVFQDGRETAVPLDDLMVDYVPDISLTIGEIVGGGAHDMTQRSIRISDEFRAWVLGQDAEVKAHADRRIDALKSQVKEKYDDVLITISSTEADITDAYEARIRETREALEKKDAELRKSIDDANTKHAEDIASVNSAWELADQEVRNAFGVEDTRLENLISANRTALEGVIASEAETRTYAQENRNRIANNENDIRSLKVQVENKQGLLNSSGNVQIMPDGSLHYEGPAVIDRLDPQSTLPVESQAVYRALKGKQDSLKAGTNITIVDNGDGYATISSSPAVTVDDEITADSPNPVSSKAIAKRLRDMDTGGVSEWAAGVPYKVNDVVVYDYTLYISMADNNTIPPTSDETRKVTNAATGKDESLPYWIAVHGGTFTPGAVTQPTYIGLFGGPQPEGGYVISHNLGCRELIWSIYTNDEDHRYILADVAAPTVNTFRVRLTSDAPANGLVISIIRARSTEAATTTLNGPTVMEFTTPALVWTYSGNDTGEPLYVQAIGSDDEGTVTDLEGDVNQSSVRSYNPVTVDFYEAQSGYMVVAPATACFDMDAASLTIEKTAANGLAAGKWYLVKCYRDTTGESILDVMQDEGSITISTGGGVAWQGRVCLYEATLVHEYTATLPEGASGSRAPVSVSYQHNQGRYVGVQAFDSTDGLVGSDVDYDGLNKVSLVVGAPGTGRILVL